MGIVFYWELGSDTVGIISRADWAGYTGVLGFGFVSSQWSTVKSKNSVPQAPITVLLVGIFLVGHITVKARLTSLCVSSLGGVYVEVTQRKVLFTLNTAIHN